MTALSPFHVALRRLRNSADLRDDWIEEAGEQADEVLWELVQEARAQRASIQECADALGVSRQAIYDLRERVNGR